MPDGSVVKRSVVRRSKTQNREAILAQATAERRQHDDVVGTTTDLASRGARIERVATQRAVDRLWIRGRITQRQYDAADRLYRTWRQARLLSGSPAAPGSVAAKGDADPEGLRQAQAREEYRMALACLTAAQISAAEWVVIWDQAPRDRIGCLDRALDALAKHYRM